MKLPISAVIPVRNESEEIDSLIKNLSFVDEILFVDNGSSDDTIKKIRAKGHRVIKSSEKSFSEIRQFGDDNAAHDWVLSMDADMRVTPVLKKEIKSALGKIGPDSYKIGRRNIIFGKEMKYTDWSPEDDCHIRFYNRATGQWKNDVHELWVTDGSTGRIKNSFLHYNYKNVEEYVSKINTYSQLSAGNQKISKGANFQFFMFKSAFFDFFKRYVYKLGFLDGYHGLMLSYLQAIYYLCLGVKMYENQT